MLPYVMTIQEIILTHKRNFSIFTPSKSKFLSIIVQNMLKIQSVNVRIDNIKIFRGSVSYEFLLLMFTFDDC